MTESDMFGIPMEEYERIYKALYGVCRTIGNGEYIPITIYDLKV